MRNLLCSCAYIVQLLWVDFEKSHGNHWIGDGCRGGEVCVTSDSRRWKRSDVMSTRRLRSRRPAKVRHTESMKLRRDLRSLGKMQRERNKKPSRWRTSAYLAYVSCAPAREQPIDQPWTKCLKLGKKTTTGEKNRNGTRVLDRNRRSSQRWRSVKKTKIMTVTAYTGTLPDIVLRNWCPHFSFSVR